MKNFTAVFWVALIVVSGFFASSCEDKGSEKPTVAAVAKKDDRAAATKDDSPRIRSLRVLKGKHYLLSRVDTRLNQLGSFKNRVANMQGLSEAERTSLVSGLNAEIAAFEAFKPEINRGVTQEEMRNTAKKIQAEWTKSQLSVVRAEKQMLAAAENKLRSDAETVSVATRK